MPSNLDVFMGIAAGRRSVRQFTGIPVSAQELLPALEAFRYAPSAGNKQPWRVLVMTGRSQIDRIGEACSPQTKIFLDAGALLVIYANPFESWAHVTGGMGGVPWQQIYLTDLGAAIQNLLLAIHAAGLGAVWIGYFNPIELNRLIEKPKELEPIALIPVGHYEKTIAHGRVKRRPLSEICFLNGFKNPIHETE